MTCSLTFTGAGYKTACCGRTATRTTVFSLLQGCLSSHFPQRSAPTEIEIVQSRVFSVALIVPAFTADDITVGISIESSAGDAAPRFILGRKDRFVHFVHKNYTGANLTLSVADEAGIFELGCCRRESLTQSMQLMMQFDKPSLMNVSNQN